MRSLHSASADSASNQDIIHDEGTIPFTEQTQY